LNGLKKELENLLNKKNEEIDDIDLIESSFDFTKPGKRIKKGHLHLLTHVEEDIRRIFTSMNFSTIEGPEIETEYYNFDALNIPVNHPARDMWDTFWLKPLSNQESKNKNSSHFLLRTHTSPMQIRYMETQEPPFQIIVPGRVFRYEETDSSHEINFYQVEGLMVGSDITLSNFKFIVEEFFKKFFSGREIEFRFRPSYFPFVEPGLEVDIKLSGDNWLEVMGAGMVHRKVFDAARYNPDQVKGFAFGMGLDRLAMIKYKIPDIRLFYSGDLRFIHQF
jgi:phenylalanyl-tRNA synthetase alpha chain